MKPKEYEMPEDYIQNLAHLTDFIETRDQFRRQINDGLARGVRVSAADKALVDEKMRDMDKVIDNLERMLAEEYERYQAEMAKEEEISEKLAEAMELRKHIYIIIKHTEPHLLESFIKNLDPLTPEEREQFFDEVAILEATQLEAILTGKA